MVFHRRVIFSPVSPELSYNPNRSAQTDPCPRKRLKQALSGLLHFLGQGFGRYLDVIVNYDTINDLFLPASDTDNCFRPLRQTAPASSGLPLKYRLLFREILFCLMSSLMIVTLSATLLLSTFSAMNLRLLWQMSPLPICPLIVRFNIMITLLTGRVVDSLNGATD